jgi:putative tricarboxylic transport membrane protein
MSTSMHDDSDTGRSLVSTHTMEIATALVIVVFASVVMISNYELGAGWDSSGPQTGYFPFYIGAILFISGMSILVSELIKGSAADHGSFVYSNPFRRVLQILIPTIVYAVAIAYIGIYVATAVFIGTFMVWLGRYRVIVAILFGVGISLALFLTFEVWFLVPLPKGPLEALLGY